MKDSKQLRALCDADTDGADLGETIVFMDMFLPLKRGFQVSDHSHAEMIMKWLCELSQYRQSVPTLIDEVERYRKALKHIKDVMKSIKGAREIARQALKGTDDE